MEATTEVEQMVYDLKLFISGASPNSARAVNNIQRILDRYLPGQYKLQIIDVHQEKAVAQKEQIVALPMLLKRSPSPVRRLLGDMSNVEKVLGSLGLTMGEHG